MAVGAWDTSVDIMGIQYQTERKILGAHFTNSVKQSAQSSWTKLTGVLRAQARDAYSRELYLAKRIQYVHTYLLARAWYIAQIFPIPTDRASSKRGYIVVQMAWRDLPSLNIHPPATEMTGKMGPHMFPRRAAPYYISTYNREEPRLTISPPTIAGSEHGSTNSRVAAGKEPSFQQHQPPYIPTIPAHMEYLRH